MDGGFSDRSFFAPSPRSSEDRGGDSVRRPEPGDRLQALQWLREYYADEQPASGYR